MTSRSVMMHHQNFHLITNNETNCKERGLLTATLSDISNTHNPPVTKASAVQKTLSGQTLTGILDLRCDLEVQHRNPIFARDIPPCDDLPPIKLKKNH